MKFLICIILGLLIVMIGFVGGAPEYILTLFLPPRIYIVLGLIIILILLKILYELKNR